jgi:ATP-dependent DNA ligase
VITSGSKASISKASCETSAGLSPDLQERLVEFFVAFHREKPAAIGVKAPFPGFIEPALATTIERVPGGQRWVHEIKFDGYRAPVISETPQSRFEPL